MKKIVVLLMICLVTSIKVSAQNNEGGGGPESISKGKIAKGKLGTKLIDESSNNNTKQKTIKLKTKFNNNSKSIVVKGTIISNFNINNLNGYILEDMNKEYIFIQSDKKPKPKEKVTVRGTLVKKKNIVYIIEKQ